MPVSNASRKTLSILAMSLRNPDACFLAKFIKVCQAAVYKRVISVENVSDWELNADLNRRPVEGAKGRGEYLRALRCNLVQHIRQSLRKITCAKFRHFATYFRHTTFLPGGGG